MSGEMVRGWFRTLDSITIESGIESVSRKALEGVRDRLVREIGWTVGIRSTSAPSADQDMIDEEL